MLFSAIGGYTAVSQNYNSRVYIRFEYSAATSLRNLPLTVVEIVIVHITITSFHISLYANIKSYL